MKALSLSLALILVALSAGFASAQTQCAARPVLATGGSALLEGSARTRARTAWMKQVAESKRLGPSYAAWLRAKDPAYSCTRSKKAYICTASAFPCKV